MNKIAKHLSPLCYLPNGTLVCYKDGKLVLLKEDIIERMYSIFTNKIERHLSLNKLLFRLLRLGVRTAIAINDNNIVLSKNNILYEFDLIKGNLSNGFFLGKGIRPLIFTSVKNLLGFDDTILFGGYLSNNKKKPVNIYARVGVDNWKIVYTFPQGVINHVHNIIPDPYRNCLWIFTGDFDDAAAIWKVTENFKKVELILCNNQNYRACVGFPLTDGLLYATDTPFKDNYIYLLKDDLSVEKIIKINGSCIYGCQAGDEYIFSSTVEPDGRNQSMMSLMLNKKRGIGIKDSYVHLYSGNLTEGFKVIYKEKKDWLPFIFQFAVFRFPCGENKTNKLYFQSIATRENDLSLMCIEI